MKKRNSNNGNTMAYGTLEKREMFAGISLESVAGRPSVVIDGSNGNDVAEVRTLQNGDVEFSLNDTTQTFARNQFERIRFLGRSGNDTFRNNTDINSFAAGHAGNDNLQGGDGHNWLRGGDGQDELRGGTRNDHLRGGAGNDRIFGGERHDRLFGGAGDDLIRGENGNDFINGEAGADQLYGGNNNDRLFGEAGADRLYGLAGNDVADGGAGNDHISLSSGNDVALFDRAFSQYDINGTSRELTVIANGGSEGTDTVVSGETLGFSDGTRPAQPTAVDLNDAEERSLTLHNQLRQNRNQNTQRISSDLSAFAESWSREMSRSGFRHSSTAQRADLIVGNRTSVSENIAFIGDPSLSQQQAAEQFHDLWVNSPAHFRNMTSAGNTEIGIGLVQTSSGWWGTVVFGNG